MLPAAQMTPKESWKEKDVENVEKNSKKMIAERRLRKVKLGVAMLVDLCQVFALARFEKCRQAHKVFPHVRPCTE